MEPSQKQAGFSSNNELGLERVVSDPLSGFFDEPDARAHYPARPSPRVKSDPLTGFFDKPVQSKPAAPRKGTPYVADFEALIRSEGAEAYAPVIRAIYKQESGGGTNARTSTDGARGGMQVMPATFKQYARQGESIDNPEHNVRVGIRIIKGLGDRFGNDAAKIATGYFSGPGNVNPGAGAAWKSDRADGNGKRVSSYAADVVARVGRDSGPVPAAVQGMPQESVRAPVASNTQQQNRLPDLTNVPPWAKLEASDEFAKFSPEEQMQAKIAYFDHYIAPHAGSEAASLREQFLAKKASAPGTGAAPLERTWGEAVGDTGKQLVEGTISFLGAPAKLFAPEGVTAHFFDSAAKKWRDKQSEYIKQKQAEADEKIRKAGEEGQRLAGAAGNIANQFGTVVETSITDPALGARTIATNLPSMLATVGFGKLMQLGLMQKGMSAAQAAQVATTATGAINAISNAGDARGDAFEDIKNTLIQQGVAPEVAEEIALKESLPSAAVGGLAGYLGGKTGAESAVMSKGAATQGGQAIARQALKAGVKSAASEILGELPEEVLPKVTTNLVAMQHDDRSIAQDVGRTIAETMIGVGPGAMLAGGAGARNEYVAQQMARTQNTGGNSSTGQSPTAVSATQQETAPATVIPQVEQEAVTPVAQPAQKPQSHPTVQAADAVVRELAQEAGVPLEIVLPQSAIDPVKEARAAELSMRAIDGSIAATEQAELSALQQEMAAQPEVTQSVGEGEYGSETSQAQPAATQGTERQQTSQTEQLTSPNAELEAVDRRRQTNLITPDGQKVAAQWDVVEADSVQASLKEGVSQPRDRSRAVSDAQVRGIAANPDFERLSDTSKTMDYGAPTLSPDGLIVGGNGRFEGISQAYDGRTAAAYRAELERNAWRFGLDSEAVRAMQKPVLVRRVTADADTRQLAIQSNQPAGLQMSDMEQAALDAERMQGLDRIAVSDTGDIPLTVSNRQAIQQALSGYSTNEVAGMVGADGGLSQSGLRRVRNAILFKAYGKSETLARLIESPDADMKNVGTALVRAAGDLAQVQDGVADARIPAEFDIAADLTVAIETLSALRADGMDLGEFLAQVDMFGGELTEAQTTIIRMLADNLRSAKNITAFLHDYAQQVMSLQDSGDGLLGQMPIPSKEEVLNRARQQHTAPQRGSATPELYARATGGDQTLQTGEGDRSDGHRQSGHENAREPGVGTDAGESRANDGQESVGEAPQFNRAEMRDMYLGHNISPEGLRHVLELGGLAAPSLAVARTSKGALDNFGSITLLADKAMIGQKDSPLFNADVYSPRHPRAEYKINNKEWSSFRKEMAGLPSWAYEPDEYELTRNGAYELARNTRVQMLFFKEHGIELKLPKLKIQPFTKKAVALARRKGLASRFSMEDDVDFQNLAKAYATDTVSRLTAANEKKAAEWRELYFNEDGSASRDAIRELSSMADNYLKAQGTDTAQARELLRKKLRNKTVSKQFDTWVNERMTRLSDGKVLNVRGRPKPYTLENVVDEMTRTIRGGENFNYGVGNIRARYAAQIDSVSDAQARRGDIISDAEFESIKKQSNDRLMSVLDALKPYYRFDPTGFRYYDDASSALAEGAKGLREAFNLDAEGKKIVDDFLSYLKTLPTSYFEMKVQRAMRLSEFSGAVVPKGVDRDVIDALKDNGLRVVQYDPRKEGARAQAIERFSSLLFNRADVSSEGEGDGRTSIVRDDSPDTQRAVGLLNRYFEELGGDSVSFQGVRTEGIDSVVPLAQALGAKVVGVKVREGLTPQQLSVIERFNGARYQGYIYLDADARRPHLAVLGHEMAHEMRANNPVLYDRMVEAIRPYVKQKEYGQWALNDIVASKETSFDKKREEFVGEVLSDGFMDPVFWQALGKKNKQLLVQVQNFLARMLQKIAATVGYTRKTEAYLTDYERVMQIAGEVMGEYGLDQGRLHQMAGIDVQFNRATGQGEASQVSGIAPAQARWEAPEPSRLEKIIHDFQDKHINLKRVQEEIGKIKQIGEQFDAYQKEELYHGRVAARVENFGQNELSALLKDMRMKSVDMPTLEAFLWARHAKERNAQIAKVNPDMPDGGSGLTDAQVDWYLSGKDVVSEDGQVIVPGLKVEQRRQLEKLASRVDEMIRGTEEILIQYGLETRETVDKWRSTYEHYVPLHREDMDGGTPIGMGFSVKGSASKRATGSSLKVVDILAHVALQREAAITRGEKNRVGLALYGLALENPQSNFWSVDKVPQIKTVDKKTGQVVIRPDTNYKSRSNVFAVRLAGVDRAIVFNERNQRAMQMVESLKNLDAEQLGWLTRSAGAVTRYFSAINTQYNPIFGIKNGLRDVQSAALNISSTELRGHAFAVLSNVPSAMKAIWQIERGGQSGTAYDQLYEDMKMSGGTTGYREIFRMGADRAKAIQAQLDSADTNVVMRGVKASLEVLDHYNTAIENGTRLAAYKKAIDLGYSKDKAASIAKNITVNFNRKGSKTSGIGAWWAFFNAAVQGTARTLQTLSGPAGKKILIGGFTLGMLQALIASIGFDDDEWEDIPEFEKQRSLIIPVGGGEFIKVPMAVGFNILPNLGRIATEQMLGRRKVQDSFVDVLAVLLESANPFGSATMLQTMSPTPTDPVVALLENKTFSGRSIAKEDTNPLQPTPGFTRARDTSSHLSRGLAWGLNRASGGTDYTPGLVSPTPDQLDYVFGSITGGVGREVNRTYQFSELLLRGEEIPQNKKPLVSSFYGTTQDDMTVSGRYWRNVRELNAIEQEVKGRVRDGLDATEFVDEHPQIYVARAANRFENRIKKMRQERSRVEFDTEIPEAERTVRLKELDANIVQAMKDYNEMVAKAKKRELE